MKFRRKLFIQVRLCKLATEYLNLSLKFKIVNFVTERLIRSNKHTSKLFVSLRALETAIIMNTVVHNFSASISANNLEPHLRYFILLRLTNKKNAFALGFNTYLMV